MAHRHSSRVLLVIALIACVVSVVVADAAVRWVLLGERVVNDRVDHDVISVTGARGHFTALKLQVLRRPVHFIDMKVIFANGDVQDVALRAVIPAGGETRVIDLPGAQRTIKRVEFTYEAESIGIGKKALIRLLGRR